MLGTEATEEEGDDGSQSVSASNNEREDDSEESLHNSPSVSPVAMHSTARFQWSASAIDVNRSEVGSDEEPSTLDKSANRVKPEEQTFPCHEEPVGLQQSQHQEEESQELIEQRDNDCANAEADISLTDLF